VSARAEELLSLAAGESSAPIRERVCAARSLQQARFGAAAINRSSAAKAAVYTNAGHRREAVVLGAAAPAARSGPRRSPTGGSGRLRHCPAQERAHRAIDAVHVVGKAAEVVEGVRHLRVLEQLDVGVIIRLRPPGGEQALYRAAIHFDDHVPGVSSR
jgi:hypothetical protein